MRYTYYGRLFQGLWNFHPSSRCAGEYCPIHNPSRHRLVLKDASLTRDGHVIRMCDHNIWHIDPDSQFPGQSKPGCALIINDVQEMDACDGCCRR